VFFREIVVPSLELIKDYDLAGIIVWECSEDAKDHRYIKQMGDYLKK